MTHLQPGRSRCVIAIGLLLALFGVRQPRNQAAETARSPDSISSLARLTPADAGLSLEIDQLGNCAAQFMGGPLFQRLAGFPPLARWVGQNGSRLTRFRGEFQRRLGVTPEKVWSGIFGGRALFAVWPPAPDSQNGPALLLVEARDRELLEAAVERIVALQRDSTRSQKSFSLPAGGHECTVRIVGSQEKREQLFLATVGTLGIAANREELIRASSRFTPARRSRRIVWPNCRAIWRPISVCRLTPPCDCSLIPVRGIRACGPTGNESRPSLTMHACKRRSSTPGAQPSM